MGGGGWLVEQEGDAEKLAAARAIIDVLDDINATDKGVSVFCIESSRALTVSEFRDYMRDRRRVRGTFRIRYYPKREGACPSS